MERSMSRLSRFSVGSNHPSASGVYGSSRGLAATLEKNLIRRTSHRRQQILYVLVLVLPIASVGGLSALSNRRAVLNRNSISQLFSRMNIAQRLRDLIQTLNYERGTSCAFTGTHRDETNYIDMFKTLLAARSLSDKAVELMRNQPDAWPAVDGYRNADQFLSMLAEKRLLIDKQSMVCIDIMDWYHMVIEQLVEQIVYEFENLGDGRLWGEINAYAAWILGKEEAGMARALGSKCFSSGHLNPEEYTEFYRLEGASEMLLRFSGMSFDKVAQMHHQMTLNNEELLANISVMKYKIFLNNGSADNAAESSYWTTHMSQYLNILGREEEMISQSLKLELEDRQFLYTVELVATLVIASLCLVLCPLFALYYLLHARYTKKLSEKARNLHAEEKKISNLLFQLLPSSIAQQILEGKAVEPESYKQATVFFSDILGFTALASRSSPMEVVTLLNNLYVEFDSILDMHDCYKVETIGDAFLVVSGVPKENEPEHSCEIASVSLEILCMMTRFRIKHMPGQQLLIRIGLHTGPVVAGVVGTKRPSYCLFGDTVNVASRMESSSQGMRVQVSQRTNDHLRLNHPEFELQPRGVQTVKGKGQMKTYWLIGKEGSAFKVDLDEAQRITESTSYWQNTSGDNLGVGASDTRRRSSVLPGEQPALIPGQLHD